MPMTATTICEQWREDRTTLGCWLAIPSTVTAEASARCGFDYVCVDTQHGPLDFSDSVSMIQAILLGGSSPIVRVPRNEPGIIGKSFDAGAHGVIVPMVNTAAEAEQAVSASRYAPRGARSWGPTVAGLRHDYFNWESGNVACIPMIETTEALSNLDEILAVPGIDAIYVGPADLSITLGLPPGNNDGSEAFDEALNFILERCTAHGVIAGIQSTGALTPERIAAGFRMVTVTTDLVAMRAGINAELALARGEGSSGTESSLY